MAITGVGGHETGSGAVTAPEPWLSFALVATLSAGYRVDHHRVAGRRPYRLRGFLFQSAGPLRRQYFSSTQWHWTGMVRSRCLWSRRDRKSVWEGSWM